MNTNTPPIIRGEFVYHNVLLVDAGGDLKRHPRASLGDIKTLLDPTRSQGRRELA